MKEQEGSAPVGTVLHVTGCVGGGVPEVIRAYVRAAPNFRHHVLWPTSNGLVTGASSVEDWGGSLRERAAALRRAHRKLGADIVHAHSSIAGAVARVTLRDVLYQPHAFAFQGVGSVTSRRLYWLAEKLLSFNTRAFVAVSSEEITLAKRLNRTARVIFVPNASRAAARSCTSPPSFPIRVCTVGRIAEQKDPTTLAAIARAMGQGAVFTWIGDGDPTLRRQLEDAGVQVTGWVGSTEAIAMLAEQDAYIHTARYEGFPLSILDAAQSGLPILARRIPALSGYGINQFDGIEEAREFLIELIEKPEAAETAKRANVELLSEMNPEAQRDALNSLYTALYPQKAQQKRSRK